MFLVAVAYDVPFRFVNGGSESIEKLLMGERFAIDAKASTSALPPAAATFMATQQGEGRVLREMLKTLLTERFNLTAHFETREFPVYELKVAPGGHKLTPAARNCEPQSAEEAISGTLPCGFQGGGPAGGLKIRKRRDHPPGRRTHEPSRSRGHRSHRHHRPIRHRPAAVEQRPATSTETTGSRPGAGGAARSERPVDLQRPAASRPAAGSHTRTARDSHRRSRGTTDRQLTARSTRPSNG